MGVAGRVTKKTIIQNETDILLWNVSHTTGVYVPVRFTSRKNQISKGAVKGDWRFFVDPYPRRLEREKPWGRGCKGGTFFSVL